MKAVNVVLRNLDALQRRNTVVAVAVGVQKKFGDDNGGLLIANVAYTGFVTVFPLLLLLVTILGLVFSSDPAIRHSILDSTLSRFPLVGSELGHNVHALHRSSLVGLVVSLVLLAYGALGLAGAEMFAMEQVWNVPGTERPGFAGRLARSGGFLTVLLLGVVLTTFLSGIGTFGSRRPLLVELAAVALGLVLNLAQYFLGFRVLTPKAIPTRALVPGALFGAVGWSILQGAGTYLVGHTLKNDSATYGTFAAVLGLIGWIYLGARVSVYAAELSCVLHRRLWPRALVQPPLTPADRRSLAAQAEQERRRPEQRVEVSFGDGSDESARSVRSGTGGPDGITAGAGD